MTVLMSDVREDYTNTYGPLPHTHAVSDTLTDLEYADDTLLFARTSETLNKLLHLVEKHSEYYGMKLNKDKTFLITMNPHDSKDPYKAPRNNPVIHYHNGDPVPTKHQVTYLGVEIHRTSNQQPNLTIRLA